jgi:hypothetical protein
MCFYVTRSIHRKCKKLNECDFKSQHLQQLKAKIAEPKEAITKKIVKALDLS